MIRGGIALVAIVLVFGRQLLEGANGDGGSLLSLGVAWIVAIVFGLVLLSALAGFFSWYFTKFVIDDEEVRVETGALFRNSRRLAFARIQSVDLVQPLAARLFGLVELRIEAGAGDRGIRLRYLKRDKADRFRHYLLTRAHGEQASLSDTSAHRPASALTDLSSADHPILTIAPGRLVGAFLLSSELLITAGVWLVVLIVTLGFGVTFYALPGLIPLAFAAFGLVSRRVLAQFHYTLAESVRGLRISRGLTNLTSQSVPVDRIQGVRVNQSLLWRPLGWYRIDVDVIGYGSSSERSENGSDVSSILVPVATRDQLAMVLDRILPGFDLDTITLHRSPPRARVIRPIDAWTFRYGWDDDVIVSRSGILVSSTDIVPHAKAQSVRLEQGPLQRLLRLASVHVDTPRGPVNLVAHHLDQTDGRPLALSELDRARAARHRGRPDSTAVTDGVDGTGNTESTDSNGQSDSPYRTRASAADRPVLARFELDESRYLGGGGESRVYAVDDARVLRIYRETHESPQQMIDQLRPAYAHWQGQPELRSITPALELPMIVDAGRIEGRVFSVDTRMSGRSFSSWLPTANEVERRTAYLSYLDTAGLIRRLDPPGPEFARPFGDRPQNFPSLQGLLHDQLQRALGRIDHVGFPEAETWARQVVDAVADRRCRPQLVHGDFFPGNTYVRRERDGRIVVRGVGDFSPHTLVADPLMDLFGAVILMELEPYDGVATDARWLADVVREQVGAEEFAWFEVYRRYYSVYYGDDPTVVAWARTQLTG